MSLLVAVKITGMPLFRSTIPKSEAFLWFSPRSLLTIRPRLLPMFTEMILQQHNKMNRTECFFSISHHTKKAFWLLYTAAVIVACSRFNFPRFTPQISRDFWDDLKSPTRNTNLRRFWEIDYGNFRQFSVILYLKYKILSTKFIYGNLGHFNPQP